MTLQDKLDAYKVQPKPNAPPELGAVSFRTISALKTSGQVERALKAGDRAPSFTLPDQDGAMVSSADLLTKGPVVLSFYRGVWCPFCNIELKALQEVLGAIEAHGASLLAISQQAPVNSREAQRENALTFPILSDKGGEVGAAFGLRWSVPEEMREMPPVGDRSPRTLVGVDLPAFNGDPSWTLPMPARIVIGQDGVIAYAEVNPDYTKRPEPSELFPVLDGLRARAAA